MEPSSDPVFGAPRGCGTWLLRRLAWIWPSVAKYTHGSLAIVTNPNGHYLMVNHRGRERGAWGFPGGTLRPHETPRAAVVREVREETGINVDRKDLHYVGGYDQPWAWHFDHLFEIEIGLEETHGHPTLEIQKLSWVDVTTLAPERLTVATRFALYMLEVVQKGEHD